MKNILMIFAVAAMFSFTAKADDRPVDFTKLPLAAQQFVKDYFPSDKVTYATKDDDLIRPDYTVRLSSGVKIDFEHSGALDNIESRAGIPEKIVPVQILDYVKAHHPDAVITGYDIGKRNYEVKLSNRLELKFNSSFHLIEIDD